MPTSPSDMVPYIVRCLRTVRPQSILDVGIGFGKYGLLAREYLELSAPSLDEQVARPALRVDGIEAFPDYVGPIQQAIYDNLFLGDARTIAPTLGSYDLVLIIDVIEHLSVIEGKALLAALLGKASQGILLTTPVVPKPQGAIRGNEFERHVSRWRPTDFCMAGARVQWMILERTFLVYIHRTGAAHIPWLRQPRLRRRLSLALRQLVNVLAPGYCKCPRI